MDSTNRITTEITNYSKAKKIIQSEWLDTDLCSCGKPVFKYQDTTNNVFVLKCKTPINEKNPKKGCNMFQVYLGTRPDYSNNTPMESLKPDKYLFDKSLENKLEILFSYLLINNNQEKQSLTIQYINYLVKFKLQRLIINDSESIIDYRNRIFSREIIDKSKIIKKEIIIPNESYFIENSDSDESSESERDSGSDSDSDEVSNKSDKRGYESGEYSEDYLSDYSNGSIGGGGGGYYSD